MWGTKMPKKTIKLKKHIKDIAKGWITDNNTNTSGYVENVYRLAKEYIEYFEANEDFDIDEPKIHYLGNNVFKKIKNKIPKELRGELLLPQKVMAGMIAYYATKGVEITIGK